MSKKNELDLKNQVLNKIEKLNTLTAEELNKVLISKLEFTGIFEKIYNLIFYITYAEDLLDQKFSSKILSVLDRKFKLYYITGAKLPGHYNCKELKSTHSYTKSGSYFKKEDLISYFTDIINLEI